MAKKKSPSVDPATLATHRKFYYFIFGDLIFRPHFDLACQYREALIAAKVGKRDKSQSGAHADPASHIDALQKKINQLALAEGPEFVVELGFLFSEISLRKNSPAFADYIPIVHAYLIFCAEKRRPPASEELREYVWSLEAFPRAKKHLGTDDRKALIRKLRKVWKSGSDELGEIKERTGFERAVGTMDLYLLDGKLVNQYFSRYEQLQTELGRNPTKKEYFYEILKIAPVRFKDLKTTDFHQFTAYLNCPSIYHPFIKHAPNRNVIKMVVDETREKAGQQMATLVQNAYDSILCFGQAMAKQETRIMKMGGHTIQSLIFLAKNTVELPKSSIVRPDWKIC